MVTQASHGETVAVGTTAVQLSENKHGRRRTWFVKNTSTGAAAAALITILPSNTQVATSLGGIVLGPYESYGEWQDADIQDSIWQGTITVISDTAASQLSFFERASL